MKKRIFLFLAMAFAMTASFAQTINGLSVVPNNPTDMDPIILIANVTFPQSNCDQHSLNITTNGNTIDIHDRHCLGNLTLICDNTDSIALPPMAAGIYTIRYHVQHSINPCTAFPTAYVVDSIKVSVSSTCTYPTNLFSKNITATSATLKWTTNAAAFFYEVRYRVVNTTKWTIKRTKKNYGTKNISGLLPSTSYLWKVRSRCGNNPALWSDWTKSKKFTTLPMAPGAGDDLNTQRAIDAAPELVALYPSPATDRVTVELSEAPARPAELVLSDFMGRVCYRTQISQAVTDIALSGLNNGVYLVTLDTGGSILRSRLVIR